MGFPALPLAIAPRGHWHAAGEPATTAAATQLARAALPSAHHHATHRGGHRDRGGGGRGGRASRGGPKPARQALRGAVHARWNRELGHGRLLVRAPRHEPTRKVPAAGLSPPSWAWPAGPPERRGRDGEAGSCPSFLPSFEIKILCSWRSAGGGPGRLCCQPRRCGDRAPRRTWASGAATPPGGTGRRRRPGQTIGGERPHLRLRLFGRWAAAGPRAWLALWRQRVVSRAGGCNTGRWAAAPSRLAVQSARPGAAAARRPLLNGPRPASGCRGDSIPVPPQNPRAPRIRRPQGSRLRRCARLLGDRPGPRLLPCLSTSNFRATSEQLKGRAETAGQGTPACPRAAAAFASSRPPRPRLAAATSAVTSPEPIGIFCVASPPFV